MTSPSYRLRVYWNNPNGNNADRAIILTSLVFVPTVITIICIGLFA